MATWLVIEAKKRSKVHHRSLSERSVTSNEEVKNNIVAMAISAGNYYEVWELKETNVEDE